ncbi:MAG: hypothetical protein MJ163_01015 [Alphaproteobacteria bacterium]|nr:hypothetical protein [Alphaproteobacteria bacterium]
MGTFFLICGLELVFVLIFIKLIDVVGKTDIKNIIKKIKTYHFKIEIVNDGKYINFKKSDRIEYLNDLKKQTTDKLNALNKKLKTENDKIRDIPDNIVKYIKPQYTTSLKREISKLENKIIAIDELIESETNNK